MKATGVVRRMDELGRIVVPIEIRRNLGIGERDMLEIFTDEDSIILKKYIPEDACIFCGKALKPNKLISFKKKMVCHSCAKKLLEKADDSES